MMEKIRAAGRSDLLPVIAGRDQRSRLAVLAPDEANFIVQMLAENQEWSTLWDKALELSPAVSQRSLQILAQNGWRPPSSDENRLYEELASLAAHPEQVTPESARRQLPPALPPRQGTRGIDKDQRSGFCARPTYPGAGNFRSKSSPVEFPARQTRKAA